MSDEVTRGDGTHWIITNPHWPNGDKPYRERCGGCAQCEPAPPITPYERSVRFQGWPDGSIIADWWGIENDDEHIRFDMHPSRRIQMIVMGGVAFLTPREARALAHDLPLILTELADRAEGKT